MKNRKGFLLPTVILMFALLMIMVPLMVKWVQDDTKLSVKDQNASAAFNLAEAAVDRAYWKVKSSTATFVTIRDGGSLAGYRFDTTYADVPGGTYRVSVTSGPLEDQITILGEGRNSGRGEVRAIKAVYQNTAIPGAVISAGNVNPKDNSVVNWGPIMAMGNITITGTAALNRYSPRKLAKLRVVGSATYPRDLNAWNVAPNWDGADPNLSEWWSGYAVPELPIFDFETMKSSAIANGTYNCGASAGSWNGVTRVWTGLKPEAANNWTLPCNGTASVCTTAVCKVGNIYADRRYNSDMIWYWDEGKTVTLYNTGVKSTIIVRGHLIVEGDDCYGPTYGMNDSGHYCGRGTWTAGPGNVTVNLPRDAWKQYRRITKTTNDTVALNQYPGDLGISSSAASYLMGSCSAACEGGDTGGDIGFYGFIYTGGNFTNNLASDVYGAVWVGGDMLGTGNTNIFYNSGLRLPLLNVVLIRESWQETNPSAQAWP